MSDIKSDLSQKDAIVINDIGSPEETIWITIKDASDLLGCSERHMWRIVQRNAWETKKHLNISRKKTFILRKDVEKFYKEEKERQKLANLQPPFSDNPDTPDKNVKNDMSDLLLKKSLSDMSENKQGYSLPLVLSEYKKVMVEYQVKQEQLIEKSTHWKTSAIWLIFITVSISTLLGFWLYDNKSTLSDIKISLSDSKNALSDAQKTLSDKEIQINSLKTNLIDLSSNVSLAQNALINTKQDIITLQKEAATNKLWIYTLEQSISKEKIEQLKEEKKELW
ncbi:hypothetical protein KKC04_04195 [Patescibacteria group bacterium]|nr:hypothetical protein [Patescibacteria group bacterium]